MNHWTWKVYSCAPQVVSAKVRRGWSCAFCSRSAFQLEDILDSRCRVVGLAAGPRDRPASQARSVGCEPALWTSFSVG